MDAEGRRIWNSGEAYGFRTENDGDVGWKPVRSVSDIDGKMIGALTIIVSILICVPALWYLIHCFDKISD